MQVAICLADVQLCSEFDGVTRFTADMRPEKRRRKAREATMHGVHVVPEHVAALLVHHHKGIQLRLIHRTKVFSALHDTADGFRILFLIPIQRGIRLGDLPFCGI